MYRPWVVFISLYNDILSRAPGHYSTKLGVYYFKRERDDVLLLLLLYNKIYILKYLSSSVSKGERTRRVKNGSREEGGKKKTKLVASVKGKSLVDEKRPGPLAAPKPASAFKSTSATRPQTLGVQ